jgi:hypothetical protein
MRVYHSSRGKKRCSVLMTVNQVNDHDYNDFNTTDKITTLILLSVKAGWTIQVEISMKDD